MEIIKITKSLHLEDIINNCCLLFNKEGEFMGSLRVDNDDDIMLGTLPLFHAFGIVVTTYLPLIEGIKCVAHPHLQSSELRCAHQPNAESMSR